jgi:hypothetical protein
VADTPVIARMTGRQPVPADWQTCCCRAFAMKPQKIMHARAQCLLAGSIILFSLVVGASALQPITVSVYPTVALTTGTAQVRVRVERNEMNRTLVWEIDGSDYYRSSSVQLDGASAPRNWLFILRNLPEGEYNLRATIIRNNNSAEPFAKTTMAVVSGGPSKR